MRFVRKKRGGEREGGDKPHSARIYIRIDRKTYKWMEDTTLKALSRGEGHPLENEAL